MWRLLLNSCISGAVKDALAKTNNVEWVGDWPGVPTDDAVLDRAQADHRLLVTLDDCFGPLIRARGDRQLNVLHLGDADAAKQLEHCRFGLSLAWNCMRPRLRGPLKA